MKKLIVLLLTINVVFGAFASGQNETGATEPVKEVELNVMMSFPRYMDQWETYCKQFEEKMLNEDNLKVKINLEMPSSDQYESVLQARLAGNDAPDLYTLHSNNIATYYKSGNLEDLSNQPLAGKVYANIKNTVTLDGKMLAVPIESQAWAALYNKDIFEECGLEVPYTLSELENVCSVLEAKGYTPFMLAYQEQWVPQLMTALLLGGKVTTEVPDWLSRMYEDKGSYEEMREIFDTIDVIMQNGTSRAMEQGSESGAAEFAMGKAAMFVQGTWASGTIMSTNPDMNLGVFALPVNENPDCAKVNISTSTTLVVHPGSSEKDVALKFANYVLDDNDSSILFESCGFNPLATCHEYAVSSWVNDASEYVSKGKAYQDLVLPSSVTNEQGKLLQEYYVKAVTVDQIIERLDKTFQEANKLNK
jgi:raffinose/stachyose/melibiose transport system substrate-binding protein